MNFEETMKRLNEIADRIESGEETIDSSLELYSEGITLVKKLNSILDNAEKAVAEAENV